MRFRTGVTMAAALALAAPVWAQDPVDRADPGLGGPAGAGVGAGAGSTAPAGAIRPGGEIGGEYGGEVDRPADTEADDAGANDTWAGGEPGFDGTEAATELEEAPIEAEEGERRRYYERGRTGGQAGGLPIGDDPGLNESATE